MYIIVLSINFTLNIEMFYYLSQIIAAIAVISGTIIALIQYQFNSKEAEKQRMKEKELYNLQIEELKKDRVQRAIDLAEYYKDNIILYVNMLKYVYDATGVSQILSKISDEKICHFDTYEMQQNITTDDRQILETFTQNENFIKTLVTASKITGFWPECREVVSKNEDGMDIKGISFQVDELIYKFNIMVQDILNNLEYFAMAFNYKTADESVVYQSLHKNYIKIVRLLYYDISVNNKAGEAKIFTNVIELYNLWKEQAERQKLDEIALTRENVFKGSVLKDVDKT